MSKNSSKSGSTSSRRTRGGSGKLSAGSRRRSTGALRASGSSTSSEGSGRNAVWGVSETKRERKGRRGQGRRQSIEDMDPQAMIALLEHNANSEEFGQHIFESLRNSQAGLSMEMDESLT